jgi:PAS domain S-box-containing protein
MLDGTFPEGERLYRLILENATDAIAIFDDAGTLLQRNRAARQLRGIDVARLADFAAHPGDISAFHAELRARGRAQLELRLPSAAGGLRRISLDGNVYEGRHVVVLRDVTAARAQDEELRHLRRVESLGYHTASLVHDFSNVLTPILLMGFLLEREVDPASPAFDIVVDIRSAAEQAAALVRQVLGRIRREPPSPVHVCLNEVVTEVYPLVARVMGTGVDVVLALDDALEHTFVETEELEHVILNLAANARDAMPRGGRLTLRTANVTLDEAGDDGVVSARRYVVLSVTDTGEGMTAEVRERIFERFFTTKEIGYGTGLGLATAHRFVLQSRGRIKVESEPGRGTTVSIFLPCSPAGERPKKGPRAFSELPRGSETVLLIEDDPRVRGVIREVLTELGYRVLEAATGEEALDHARGRLEAIDLVLTDVVIPGTRASALVKELHAASKVRRTLFMSGHTERTLAEHGIREGEHPLLRKAFTPTELAKRVREILDDAAS